MSVLMTLHIKADGQKLESYAAANQDVMAGIVRKAEQHGLIAHRFYSDGKGAVMVLDEWPDAQSFQAFFDETHDDIGQMMAAADAQGEPDINSWQELRTPDRYGWGVEAAMR